MTPFPLIAADVGNARTKVGVFRSAGDDALPTPEAVCSIDNAAGDLGHLAAWLDSLIAVPLRWWIGSVNRPAAARLVDWLQTHRPDDATTLLAQSDLPIHVELPRPEQVGIDRLLGALAANHLRTPGRAAVVVDVGTAITVELVSAEGAFRGGAILPGVAMSARALHEFTDLLPLVDVRSLVPSPPAIGTSTESAITSGLFWGAVGAIRELIRQVASAAALAKPAAHPPGDGGATAADVFVTGGDGAALAGLLDSSARYVSELTLAGIALAAQATANA